jgi:hypothetical protein
VWSVNDSMEVEKLVCRLKSSEWSRDLFRTVNHCTTRWAKSSTASIISKTCCCPCNDNYGAGLRAFCVHAGTSRERFFVLLYTIHFKICLQHDAAGRFICCSQHSH